MTPSTLADAEVKDYARSFAADVIAELGFHAELFVIKMISEFTAEGDINSVIEMNEVFKAMKEIRAESGIVSPGHIRVH